MKPGSYKINNEFGSAYDENIYEIYNREIKVNNGSTIYISEATAISEAVKYCNDFCNN